MVIEEYSVLDWFVVKKIILILGISTMVYYMVACQNKVDNNKKNQIVNSVCIEKNSTNNVEATNGDTETMDKTTEEKIEIKKSVKFKKKYENGCLHIFTEYDENGNEIKEIIYNIDTGDVTKSVECSYDEKGNIIERKDSSDQRVESYKYDYDIYDNIIKKEEYYDGRKVLSEEYKLEYYDDNKLKKIITEYDDVVTTKEYDKNGKLIKTIKMYSDGAYWEEEYEYDTYNNFVKEIGRSNYIYKSSDINTGQYKVLLDELVSSIDEEYKYEYDLNGNMIRKYVVGKDGEVLTNEYVYDENENMIEEYFPTSEGSYGGHTEWQYDNDGNIIKETKYFMNGNVGYYIDYEYYE